MAYTTINKSTDYFNTKLYTGTGATRSITGIGFQPDWIWTKGRSGTYSTESHKLYDAVRGTTKELRSDVNNAESTNSGGVTSFDSDGYGLGAGGGVNGASTTYVSWNWLANGQGSANSDGTITTTYTSANTTAGFSIVTYTGNGTSGATIGHGLGAVPNVIMVKRRDTTGRWQVYHSGTSSSPQEKYLFLDGNEAQQDGTNRWNDTAPTSSVFSLGNSTEVNANSGTYVAYCFTEKTGYSKFGVYTGNNSTDGTFVYTGFKPTWGLFKNKSIAGNWILYDVKRDPYNVMNTRLFPDTSNADDTGNNIDFLSNGFKHRTTGSGTNGSHNYVYLAFGQSLVGSNNVPCTAR
jgi:hypothetical protein